MRKRQIVLCLFVFGLLSGSALYAQRTSAVVDRFDVIVEMSIQLGDTRSGADPMQLFLAGPVVVQRNDPSPAPGPGSLIQTEILSMDLTGTFTDPGGRFAGVGPTPFKTRLTESARQSSRGEIRTIGRTFEGASSFFNVFLELEIGGQKLSNDQPVRLEGVINTFPPIGSGYSANLIGPEIVLRGGSLTANLRSMDFNPANPNDKTFARQLGLVQEYVQQIRATLFGIASFLSVNISGTLKDCRNSPVSGVEIQGLTPATTPPSPQFLLTPFSKDTTDTNGAYSFNVPYGSSGQVSIPSYPNAQPNAMPIFTNLKNNLVINFTSTMCP